MKRWLLTYFQATQILHAWGERAWPWNVPVVWKMAAQDVATLLRKSR